MRHQLFKSLSLSSTEGFCEKPHNGALKLDMPVGKLETGEWLKAIYPYLSQYKMPPRVVLVLVYRQRAEEIWGSSDIQGIKDVSCIRWAINSFLQDCVLSQQISCIHFLFSFVASHNGFICCTVIGVTCCTDMCTTKSR